MEGRAWTSGGVGMGYASLRGIEGWVLGVLVRGVTVISTGRKRSGASDSEATLTTGGEAT